MYADWLRVRNSAIILCRYIAILLIYYGIVGGRIGGWGIEGMTDRVVRNGIRDGLAVDVAFRFIVCPFLYRVKVMSSPAILC